MRCSMSDFAALNALLDYNSETGVLQWKNGREAGTLLSNGYRQVGVRGKCYKSHRVAWLLSTGEWPAEDIDHINGNRADNRIVNLRSVSRAINLQNRRKARKGSRSGLIGVSYHKQTGRYNAQIWAGGRNRSLGLFDTAEEAHVAYIDAKRQLHAGFVENHE